MKLEGNHLRMSFFSAFQFTPLTCTMNDIYLKKKVSTQVKNEGVICHIFQFKKFTESNFMHLIS